MRFWVSWVQPTEDYRPLTDPPAEPVLGWWNSGSDANGNATLCALVSAKDEEAAKGAVRTSWPEAATWRFCDAVDEGWVPNDRFPITKPWEHHRIFGSERQ